MNSHSNPLMQREGLPKFDQIKAEDFVPAVRAVFTKTENVLKDVEEHSEPTWDSLIKPFDETDLDWEYTWSVLNHLKSVKNSAELRKAYDELM
ncbi:MAG: M3 family peptidase, partial [Candidatus Riflebacteria bacterium]|nr:M3 family peptidase [Candidatus Riflebacteria bacterium]